MRNSLPAMFHRTIIALLLVLAAFAPFALAQNADNVLRIGYQKYGTLVLPESTRQFGETARADAR